MWLKDSQDNLQESKCSALYSSRRLRHLLPRPTTSINKNAPCCVISSSYCSCFNNNIVFSMNHQQTSAADDQSSKDEKHMKHVVSSRWNPTPEQLMALEEMYRRGIKTPSAEEIKLITAKLRQFGRIEGKNVFYWFQNHKARERQKRRRQPEPTSKKFGNDKETLERNDKGFSSKDLEAEENNKLTITSSKEPVSMQRPMGTESETDGWIHLDEGEMQQMSQRKMAKAAAKLMDLSCRASNSDILNTITAHSAAVTSGEAQQKMLSTLNFSIFSSSCNADMINHEDATRDHQTLELFPLQNDGHCSNIIADDTDFKEFMATMNANLPPNQFYEFL